MLQTSKTAIDNSLYRTRSAPLPALLLGGRNRHFLQSLLFVPSVAKYYYVAGLTMKSSRFCPHSVFVCFVRIWEQTAITSLYSTNWLVCVTEPECVYSAVRAGSLNTIQSLKRQIQYADILAYNILFDVSKQLHVFFTLTMKSASSQCCKAGYVTNVTEKHAGSILRVKGISHAPVEFIFRTGYNLEQTPESIYRI